MLRRLTFRISLAVLTALLLATPALAGCCMIISLDALPGQIVAGQPIQVGFMMRVNHSAWLADEPPAVTVRQADGPVSFTETARAEGVPGHYVTTLTFPSAGLWQWSIGTQPMPDLTALATTPDASSTPFSLPVLLGVIGLIGVAGAWLVSQPARRRLAPVTLLVVALIGVSGFAFAATSAAHSGQSLVETGRALLIAKGCVVCHRHDGAPVSQKDFHSAEAGPNLTELTVDPDFLRRWLKDPSAVKPGTFMPTLGLSDTEIEALVAFINTK